MGLHDESFSPPWNVPPLRTLLGFASQALPPSFMLQLRCVSASVLAVLFFFNRKTSQSQFTRFFVFNWHMNRLGLAWPMWLAGQPLPSLRLFRKRKLGRVREQ